MIVSEDKIEALKQGEILGKTFVYCEQVSTGAKPVAELMCPVELQSIVEDEIRRFELLFQKDQLTPDWVEYHIFKDQIYISILACIKDIPKSIDQAIFKEWVVGKMYGYSEECIRIHIHDNIIKDE